jgi:L-lactate dehydrogenase (cytochrome)
VKRWVTVDDARAAAHKRWPAVVRDYVEGGAESQVTLARNVSAYGRYTFHPRLLSGAGVPSLETGILGVPSRLPFGLAPTGYSRMMHPDGEPAIARAAARQGVPYVASTMATTAVTAVAAPETDLWFQLYVFADRGVTWDLIARAEHARARAIVVTVDSPVTGSRPSFLRHALIPPAPSHPLLLRSALRRPRWGLGQVRQGPLGSPNLTTRTGRAGVEATELLAFEPSLTWDDIAAVRSRWPGKLLLKGPIGAPDAARARDLGVDGVVLSNHGGRQLDQLDAPVHAIRAVRERVGDGFTVLVDSGVRRGSDIAVALALGADAALVGRPYVYGLGGGGEAGVDAVIGILAEELRRTLQLLGVSTVAELRSRGAELVRPAF